MGKLNYTLIYFDLNLIVIYVLILLRVKMTTNEYLRKNNGKSDRETFRRRDKSY